jgi:hypothetical protein
MLKLSNINTVCLVWIFPILIRLILQLKYECKHFSFQTVQDFVTTLMTLHWSVKITKLSNTDDHSAIKVSMNVTSGET